MVIGFPRRNIFASTKCALPIVILVMPPKTVKPGSMALQQFRGPVQFGATEDSLRLSENSHYPLITHSPPRQRLANSEKGIKELIPGVTEIFSY